MVEFLPETENPYHTVGLKPPSVVGEFLPRFVLASEFGPRREVVSGFDKTFAPGVLHAVRDGWEALRATDEDLYVGLTVTGSLVKGRAHTNSDVDGTIFFDPDSESGQKIQHQQAGGQAARNKFVRETALAEHVLKGVTEVILPAVRSAGYPGPMGTYPGSYVKRPMNERMIGEHLQNLNRSPLHLLAGTGFVTLEPDIVNLFGLRLGSGKVQAFRKIYLDGLSDRPGGNLIWSHLMDRLHAEEELKRGADIYLPQTLGDAYDYFRIPK